MKTWKTVWTALVLGLCLLFSAGCGQEVKQTVDKARQAKQQVEQVKDNVAGLADKKPLEIVKTLIEITHKGDGTFPKDLQVQGVTIKDGLATVDLNPAFLTKGRGEHDTLRMVYSIVNTLTELPNVKKVSFTVNGKKVEVLDQLDLSDPLERNKDFGR